MIVRSDNYMVISSNSNNAYWVEALYPRWAAINTFRYFPGQKKGQGVEPHYHDGDELWLFLSGRGEVWLDGKTFPLTANTAVYTPMGVVHRFQMFIDFENIALVTRLERQKRATHILVEESGPPVPTVPGLVIAGAENTGPFSNRGSRCPLSELRMVTLPAGATVEGDRLAANEYWLALSGVTSLAVDGAEFDLATGDVALLRAGVVRRLRSVEAAGLAVARE